MWRSHCNALWDVGTARLLLWSHTSCSIFKVFNCFLKSILSPMALPQIFNLVSTSNCRNDWQDFLKRNVSDLAATRRWQDDWKTKSEWYRGERTCGTNQAFSLNRVQLRRQRSMFGREGGGGVEACTQWGEWLAHSVRCQQSPLTTRGSKLLYRKHSGRLVLQYPRSLGET